MPDRCADRFADTGLGDPQAQLRVYLANRPDIEPFAYPGEILPLADGEIALINAHEGNHWRKIFNVYAKLLYELTYTGTQDFNRWQDYRDQRMLQPGSGVALCYGKPHRDMNTRQVFPNILMGKQFAQECGFSSTDGAQWLSKDFAINDRGWIVCPYFDYRQLSNEKIRTLTSLLQGRDFTSDSHG